MKNLNEKFTTLNEFSSLYGAKHLSKNTLITCFGYNIRTPLNYIKKKVLTNLSGILKKKFIGKKLQESIYTNIQFSCQNKTYKGIRHKISLPVRGQRTHTNAKTCKKKLRHKNF